MFRLTNLLHLDVDSELLLPLLLSQKRNIYTNGEAQQRHNRPALNGLWKRC